MRDDADRAAAEVLSLLDAVGTLPAVVFVAGDVADALRAHPTFERLRRASGVEIRTDSDLAPGTWHEEGQTPRPRLLLVHNARTPQT